MSDDKVGRLPQLDEMLLDVSREMEQRQSRMEEEIWRRVEAEFSFSHAPVLFIVVDGNNKIRRTNHAAKELLGLSSDDENSELRLALCCCKHQCDPHQFLDCRNCGGCSVSDAVKRAIVEQKRTDNDEARLWRKVDNIEEERSFLVSAVPFALAGESYALVCLQDVTDWKRVQQEVSRSRRLDALSTLTGGLAHEFNNLLNVIIGYASLASSEHRAGRDVDKFLSLIKQVAFSAAEVSNDLLSIACLSPPERKFVNLPNLISQASFDILNSFDTKISYDIEEALSSVEADPVQLQQAFGALLTNAAQAMSGKGEITVKARNLELMPDSPLPLPPGRYVHIEIVDKGEGIPADKIEHVFSPRYSTKSGAHGLGLTAALAIVMRMDGHLNLSSTPGGGTIVHLYLPSHFNRVITPLKIESDAQKATGLRREIFVEQARGALQQRLSAQSELDSVNETTDPGLGAKVGESSPSAERLAAVLAEAENRASRVLVLEDNELLRKMTEEMLQNFGWDVVGVADGDAAVKCYEAARTSSSPFDVVILDLSIRGGAGGRDALRQMRELDPDVRAIVASGYTNDPVMVDYADYGFSGAIGKPYSFLALDALLRSVISH